MMYKRCNMYYTNNGMLSNKLPRIQGAGCVPGVVGRITQLHCSVLAMACWLYQAGSRAPGSCRPGFSPAVRCCCACPLKCLYCMVIHLLSTDLVMLSTQLRAVTHVHITVWVPQPWVQRTSRWNGMHHGWAAASTSWVRL